MWFVNGEPTVGFIQDSRAASQDDACMISEVLTLLAVTQISSG